MPLFEVAILQKPTRKESGEGTAERLMFGPKAVVAKDAQAAAITAAMDEAKQETATICLSSPRWVEAKKDETAA